MKVPEMNKLQLERRLRRLEEATSKKVNESHLADGIEYLMRNGKFGEYHDAREFPTFEAATKASKAFKDSQVEEDAYGNFIVYILTSKSPWETADELLEDIVYGLDQQFGGNVDKLRKAVEPSINSIFKRIQQTKFN